MSGSLVKKIRLSPSPFESLVKKIVCTENNENNGVAMIKPNLTGEKIHIMDRVPDVLRQQNENAYTPTTISIGPLHRGSERLQAMEPVKLSYARALLQRYGTFEKTTQDCVEAMLNMEEDVRKCYGPTGLQPNTENVSRLAEVMLVDGCFIIELLYRNFQKDYDPILWHPFKFYAVQRDLLLLENQIPFNVLQQLYSRAVESKWVYPSLAMSVLLFFGDILMGHEKNDIRDFYMDPNPYHILHIFHSYYLQPIFDASSFLKNEEVTQINYSATELHLAGVELKAAGKRNLFDIKFTTAFSCSSCSSLFRKGHFEISPFSISESTESFLKNLVAFELSCPWIASYFTSFAFLMDILIDSPEDVKLFEEAEIIHNYLGSRDEVARLFNGICKNAIPRCFIYRDQYKQAMNFCNWRVSTGRLRHYYFGNPWSGISVIAAIILFTLAFLSTLYTMLSYY